MSYLITVRSGKRKAVEQPAATDRLLAGWVKVFNNNGWKIISIKEVV